MKLRVSNLILFLFLLITGIIYWLTRSPSIMWVDAGTMIAAASTLGIPNPPGFPFFMLMSHTFTLIPIWNILSRMQLFSVLFSLFTLVIIFKTIYLILYRLISIHPNPAVKNVSDEKTVISKFKIISASLFGTAALAFSYSYWSQSTNTDAFIFSYFFVALIFFICLKLYLQLIYRESDFIPQHSYHRLVYRHLLLIAILYGLAAGTSPTVAAGIPAVLYIMYLNRKALSEKKVILLGMVFLIVLSAVYAYLPLRAAADPFVNWGDPRTIERFVNHLAGVGLDIYRPDLGLVNGFHGSVSIFFSSIIYAAAILPWQFTPLLLPFAAIGIKSIFKKDKRLALLLLLTPLTLLFYSGLYASGNRESWLIIPWMYLAILIGLGFYQTSKQMHLKSIKLLAFWLLCMFPLFVFFIPLNRSRQYQIADYGYNLYAPLKKNAILISEKDFFNSLSNYFRVADTYRTDVTPIVINNLYAQKWYRDNLKRTTNLNISENLENIIQYQEYSEYNQMVNQFIADNIENHPIYVTHLTLRSPVITGTVGGLLSVDKRFKLIPHGLTLEVIRASDAAVPNMKAFNFNFRSSLTKKPFYLEANYDNGYRKLLFEEYLHAYKSLGEWYFKQNEYDEALRYYRKAQKLAPYNMEVLARFGELYLDLGEYHNAIAYLQKATVINPNVAANYFNLGLAYSNLQLTTKAKEYFTAVKNTAKPDDPLSFMADEMINKLNLPLFIDPELTKQTVSWAEFKSETSNFTMRLPPGFNALENTKLGNVIIESIEKSPSSLTLSVYFKMMPEIFSIEQLANDAPKTITQTILETKAVKISGFDARLQTITSTDGTSAQRIILSKANWAWYVTASPLTSENFEMFYYMLSTFQPINN